MTSDTRILDLVGRQMGGFTAGEGRAARALLGDYPLLGLGSVGAFAKAAGTSPQSVLRFAAKLGFAGYGAFQAALKDELSRDLPSPLERLAAQGRRPRGGDVLGHFGDRIAQNIQASFARLSRADFSRAAALLADRRRPVTVLGGRFTQALAHHLTLHLEIIRGNVRRPDPQAAAWPDRLLDLGRRDVVVIFDIRRYQADVRRFAEAAAERGAELIVLTDAADAPLAALAAHLLVAETGAAAVWDSVAALLAVSEALIARVSELEGTTLDHRLQELETLRSRMGGG